MTTLLTATPAGGNTAAPLGAGGHATVRRLWCPLQNAAALAKAKRIQAPNIRLMIENETGGPPRTLPFQQMSLFTKSDGRVH